jgi:hypothetical protein
MYISKVDFVIRWHDFVSSKQRIYNQVGIIVRKKNGEEPEGKARIHHLLD